MLRKLLIALPLFFLSSCATFFGPAKIERRDAQTVYWDGPIEMGDDKKFEAMLTPQTRRLVMRSGGGDVLAGLRMGLLIHKLGLDVEVDTFCASSCANYIFMAGKRKIVPPGAFVGFHGTQRNSPSWAAHVERVKGSTEPQDIANRAYIEEIEPLTDEFFSTVGVNPKLYDYSVGYTLSNKRQFWVPSPRELECMNVRGLEMWFSEDLKKYTLGKFSLIMPMPMMGTSAQDKRNPRPDICAGT